MYRLLFLLYLPHPFILLSGVSGRAGDDAEAIVAKAIRAHGGIEKLAEIKAERIGSKGKGKPPVEVNLNVEGDKPQDVKVRNDVADLSTEKWYMFPDRLKQEIAWEPVDGVQTRTVMVFNKYRGKLSVFFNGKKHSESLSAEQRTELREELHRKQAALLACLKGGSYILSALNLKSVLGKPALGVRVKAQGYRDMDLFFDKKTGLLVQMLYEKVDLKTDKKVLVEELITDYQKLDGVTVPKKMVSIWSGKKIAEETLTEIRFFKTLDKKLFTDAMD